MILWSKGLGRLVLNLRLSERWEMREEEEGVILGGVRGEPTYWDFAVTIGEDDVVDFVRLLEKPVPLRFLVGAKNRWVMVRAAFSGGVIFAFRTLGCLVTGAGRRRGSRESAGSPAAEAARETGGSGNGGS